MPEVILWMATHHYGDKTTICPIFYYLYKTISPPISIWYESNNVDRYRGNHDDCL